MQKLVKVDQSSMQINTITMEGDSVAGLWSGSGTVAADGTFTIPLTFESSGPAQATGTVSSDCSTIEGTMDTIDFSGDVSEGYTSIDDCRPT